jgi:hypothetical protein
LGPRKKQWASQAIGGDHPELQDARLPLEYATAALVAGEPT